MPTLRSIIAALSLLLLTLSCAHAATLNVPTSQYPTIQAGINAAAPGDTVLVADGTYTGPGNVDLDFGGKSIVVMSANGAGSTIIDCQASGTDMHRGFYFHSGEPATAMLSNFTVKNGYPPADLSGHNEGGGVDILIGSSPTIIGCILTSNQLDGIHAESGTITQCTFTNNQRAGLTIKGSPSITQCTFASNPDYGLETTTQSVATVTNCTFTSNGSTGLKANGGGMTVTGCAFTSNLYGGMYIAGGTVSNCTFTNNQSIGMSFLGNGTVSACTFTGNNDGVSINGSPTVTNSAFISSHGNGADVYKGSPAFINCAFTGNQSDGVALNTGNITNSGITVTLTNCIFNNNLGGVVVGDSASATITNCTFAGNNELGLGLNGTGSASLANCILYGDTAEVVKNSSSVAALSYCDVQGGYAGTGNINADPLFVRNPNPTATPLDYGDLHLRPGSPCLGAGTANGAPTTDIDGNLRPNPPSIGAYEVTNAPIPGRFDFNMDGSNDLLWHNTSTGQTLVWNMSDQNVVTYGSPFATVPNTDWTVAATADVNGDGHPDLLWQNTRTGQVLFWLMGGTNGQQVLSYGSPFATVSDTHWHVVSMADFNGDGHPDMLWQNNATNQLVIWYLNGTQVITYGNPFATVSDTHWQVAGVADFDGDGRTDLLWENSATGQVVVWNLGGADGTSVLSYGSAFATVPNTAWRVVGTGDMNGDGHPDLVWQNVQTGQVLRWLMGGAGGMQVQAYGSPFAVVPDTHWQIVGVH